MLVPDTIVEMYYNQVNVRTGPPPNDFEMRNGYVKVQSRLCYSLALTRYVEKDCS